MTCTNISLPCIEPYIDLNTRVLNQIMEIPDGLRKEIRLMAKQYEILEVYQEPPMQQGGRIVRENPCIVKYCEFGTKSPVFEWTVFIR